MKRGVMPHQSAPREVRQSPKIWTQTSPSRCRWRAGRPGFVKPPRPLPTNPTSKTRTSGFPESRRREGEHILASAVVRRFARNAAGEFELLIEGSTRPVATTVTHARICRVERYTFKDDERSWKIQVPFP
jgi:hypothetical protein